VSRLSAQIARARLAAAVIEKRLLDDLGSRVGEAMRASPAQDLEKNLRALLVAFFDRFDLVAREDFEVQQKLLARAQEKLSALEARITELETRSGGERAA